MLLLAALTLAGGLAAVLTPRPQVAVADESSSALLRTGKQLFDTSCVSCHGANLQGVPDRGPSLIGVGEAAVYFQVSTGRMPARRGEAQAERQERPVFDQAQIDALGAYVQANGGGPTVLRNPDGSIAQQSLRGKDLGRGGDLFRLNCSSCHNFTGKGGALSSGKWAPDLGSANEQQILTAMLTGPQNMPKFADRQLSFEAKKDIIAYVKSVTEERSEGGYGLGGFGPAPEGMAIWIIGMVAVIGLALWIGARS
ncbi:cytochrome bc1 complex cytochrome c subunit [Mycobacterium botniense]|uniref:Cytochrome bc1 complex cytochrome c subunit n=1 Tax=Mycobacterium botniense TaxID=84962 RepID=A0A7I9Y0J8_9MYCO|nr:cytochrome bc1 complex cytochrome c subunit [Mycobacterium botniense]